MNTSAEKEWQERLIASDRLFLIGELAASIAHEFSNPLQIVLMLVHELARDGSRTRAQFDALNAIENEIEHCRVSITNLLDFIHSQDSGMALLSIEPVIRDSVKLIQGYLRKAKIDLNVEVSPALPEIRADPVQLKQLLTHLFFNAAQAMPEGGTLRVRATMTPALSTDRTLEHEPVGQELTVAISHSRNGIAPDESVKSGRGRLGLSSCERIISAHGGRMETEDRPGEGITFNVHLPLAIK